MTVLPALAQIIGMGFLVCCRVARGRQLLAALFRRAGEVVAFTGFRRYCLDFSLPLLSLIGGGY